VEEIIEDFYGTRILLYGKRKAHLIADMEKKLVRLSNRAKYILATLDGSVDLRKKTAAQVTALLEGLHFAKIDDDFKYLVKMPMDSVTQENVTAILKEKADTEAELGILKSTSLEKMWLGELDNLSKEYDVYKSKREKIQNGVVIKIAKKK
jgi:DNA topoisomerase-2